MKKFSYLAMAAIFAVSMTSCKKDRVCSCTIDGDPFSFPIADSKKKDAKDACDAFEDTANAGGADASCDLE